MKILGIIPARANSKGVPNKNRQLLAGKSLILHAIDIAIASNVLDRIVVSSDDDIILEEARSREAVDVPFKRPSELALDGSLISDVIFHLLQWLWDNQHYRPDAFMLLEPTSPLRNVEDICLAVKQFAASKKDCLMAVSEPLQHPSNMIYEREDHWDYCLARKKTTLGRQDFHEAWFINGAVYITKTDFFLAHKKVYDLNRCELYKMPADRAVDINSEWDLALVRAYVNQTEHLVEKGKEKYARI